MEVMSKIKMIFAVVCVSICVQAQFVKKGVQKPGKKVIKKIPLKVVAKPKIQPSSVFRSDIASQFGAESQSLQDSKSFQDYLLWNPSALDGMRSGYERMFQYESINQFLNLVADEAEYVENGIDDVLGFIKKLSLLTPDAIMSNPMHRNTVNFVNVVVQMSMLINILAGAEGLVRTGHLSTLDVLKYMFDKNGVLNEDLYAVFRSLKGHLQANKHIKDDWNSQNISEKTLMTSEIRTIIQHMVGNSDTEQEFEKNKEEVTLLARRWGKTHPQ
jgi:hypothetical protein